MFWAWKRFPDYVVPTYIMSCICPKMLNARLWSLGWSSADLAVSDATADRLRRHAVEGWSAQHPSVEGKGSGKARACRPQCQVQSSSSTIEALFWAPPHKESCEIGTRSARNRSCSRWGWRDFPLFCFLRLSHLFLSAIADSCPKVPKNGHSTPAPVCTEPFQNFPILAFPESASLQTAGVLALPHFASSD